MKKLILIRHAKSSRSIAALDDIDRPLNERGYSDALLMGYHLRNEIELPAKFITSPAVRAYSTALIIAREAGYNTEDLVIRRGLYETSVSDYLEIIREQDDRYYSVVVFGHNPTIADMIEKLAGPTGHEIPTCAITIFSFNKEKWSEISGTELKILKFLIPADFREKPI